MPRSTTVWAAALVLASFSGSGPILTTAEAMPARGPQETHGRPRYYFPRHVKRQIVTNTTAAPLPTPYSTPPSGSSSEPLETRQFPDFKSFVDGMYSGQPDPATSSSSQDLAVKVSEVDPSSTLSPSEPLNPIDSPSPVAAPSPDAPEEQQPEDTPAANIPIFAPTGGLPASVLPPTSPPPLLVATPNDTAAILTPASDSPLTPSSTPADAPYLGSTSTVSAELSTTAAPTGQFPQIVIPSLSPSAAPTGQESLFYTSSSVLASPSSEPIASEPIDQVSSPLEPFIPSTGAGLPSSVPQPTQSAFASEALSSLPPVERVISTGLFPESNSIVLPTPSPVPSAQPSPTDASSFLGPFIVPSSSDVVGSTGSMPTTILQPTSSGEPDSLPSLPAPLEPSLPAVIGTGSVSIPVVLPTSGAVISETESFFSMPSSGIIVGITTAIGTGDSASLIASPTAPAPASGAIPTSESVSASSGSPDLPSVLPSTGSELPGIVPSSGLGPTATAPTSSADVSGVLPPVASSIISDLSSILSSAVSDTAPSATPSVLSSILSGLPIGSAPIVASTSLASGLVPSETLSSAEVLPSETLLPSGILPSSGAVPTGPVSSGAVSSSGVLPIPSETLFITPSDVSATLSASPSPTSVVLPSDSVLPSGSVGSSAASASTPLSNGYLSVPASEQPPSTTSTGVPSSVSLTPPNSGNATASEVLPSSAAPTSSAVYSTADSATIPIPTIASSTSKPAPIISLTATATDSATSLVVGTSIIMEQSTVATPSPTSSGIPSSLPKMIAPPGGLPSQMPQNSFIGQVCFKWPLNYPFVSANDGGAQIFHYLPIAIADGLNISRSEVQNMGLKPLDTTQYQGFITTLALFTIPSDLQTKLAAQLLTPSGAFWHNKNSTVNDLTNLINTACPLTAGGTYSSDNDGQNEAADPAATSTGGAGDGGALGGDIGASRKVNSTSAIVASSAIVGAIAYGAAMFFIARRYRNKRLAHQRASSVPSTSRMTYGSIPGGAAAWMHGARNGRITPGSRGSRGSGSSQGRSVRTQQISAPVMAENSLGWN